jgi:hypothetical protein
MLVPQINRFEFEARFHAKPKMGPGAIPHSYSLIIVFVAILKLAKSGW